MAAGIVLFPNPQAVNVVDDVVAQARRAYHHGVRQVWLGKQFDYDAIALAALVGAAVPGLGVGTSVVPINPRHPLVVASLAQTAQAASHGNSGSGSDWARTLRNGRRSGCHGPTRSHAFAST